MAEDKAAHADESLLSRWSRRKLEADENDVVTVEPVDTAVKPLTDADMPDLKTLTEASDFSGFMSSGVSDELRNLALRKLFHAPVFNIRDGLDEYDEDYTSFEKLGDIITSDMKHHIEVQQQKRREAQELKQQPASLDETEVEDNIENSGEIDEQEPVVS